jgi:hypothetical protein
MHTRRKMEQSYRNFLLPPNDKVEARGADDRAHMGFPDE